MLPSPSRHRYQPRECEDYGLIDQYRDNHVMRPSERSRAQRRIVAIVLATVAIGLVVIEPFPKGVVLLSFTELHGIDAGDLPAIVLLLLAAWLAL